MDLLCPNKRKCLRVIFGFILMMSFNSCRKEYLVPIPQTVEFEQNLSAYNLYDGEMSNLTPSSDVHLLELSSILYSNYAKKQRLVKIPSGTAVTQSGSGIPTFPDGTILVKTFYYYLNETDASLGKQIIETRLLIKESGEWNVASYEWNASQTEATLKKEGLDTQVSWIDAQGINRTIDYRIPSQNECVKCHQNSSEIVPLGPSLRNLNRNVVRGGTTVNQLDHLQSVGILNAFDIDQASTIPDYNDVNVSLAERGRAYLDINCATCHHPNGLSEAEKKGYDFRYETSLDDTKILKKKSTIIEVMEDGRMPDVGTTVIDEEGLELIIAYMNSL